MSIVDRPDHVIVRGLERGEPVAVIYHRGEPTIGIDTASGFDELPLSAVEFSVVSGTLTVGARRIDVDEPSRAVVGRLLAMAGQAQQALDEERRHKLRVLGIVLALLSLPLFLAACAITAADSVSRDTCRGVYSWQTEREVDECEGSNPVPGIAIGAGALLLSAGVVLIIRGSD